MIFILFSYLGEIMANQLVENIRNYINQRYKEKVEKVEKEFQKQKEASSDSAKLAQLVEDHNQKLQELKQEFDVANWLDEKSAKAGQIVLATHVIKFLNSSAQGCSLIDKYLAKESKYLDTQSLRTKILDTVCNAGLLDIANFLELKDSKGSSLLDYLNNQNSEPLQSFADPNKPEQLSAWMNGFRKAFESSKIETHTLAKQIFFPLTNGSYHLLMPLYSSSLSQALFNEVESSIYSKEMKEIRQAKKQNEDHEGIYVVYPNLAVTIAGGSKPQNISKLNCSRRGKTYLFRSAPPMWRASKLPKFTSKNFLNHYEIYAASEAKLNQLAHFLLRVNTQSVPSNVRIRGYIKNTVNEIIDQVLFVVMKWRQLPSGWTDQVEINQLDDIQRQFLDLSNKRFVGKELKLDTISELFARWLKDRINEKSNGAFTLSNVEVGIWNHWFQEALRDI